MHRRSFLAAVLSAAAVAGCGQKALPELTTAELEAFVAKRCGFKEVKLEARADGSLAGTGRDRDGRAYQVEVSQTADRVTWKASHKEGGSDINLSGSRSR